MGNRRKPRSERRKSITREQIVNIPTDEKTVIKIVPATHDGKIVGDTYLYDDGSVEVVYTSREAEMEVRQAVLAEINKTNRENGTHITASELGLDI